MANPEELPTISNERRQQAQQATMECNFRAMKALIERMERLEARYQAQEEEYVGDGSDEGDDDQVTLLAARGERSVVRGLYRWKRLGGDLKKVGKRFFELSFSFELCFFCNSMTFCNIPSLYENII